MTTDIVPRMSRRQFAAAVATAALFPSAAHSAEPFGLRYLLASAMYGTLPLDTVLTECSQTGATHIDIWRKKHADHREQIEQLGQDRFAKMLAAHHVGLGATTIWNQPFADELKFVQHFGGQLLVTGFVPERQPRQFLEKLKPQLAVAEECGVTVAFENHGADSDAIRRFAEVIRSDHVGIALAPYHLPQEPDQLARLIEDLGPRLRLFYAWQHGKGAMQKLPKEQELEQLPGRGPLDFVPLLAALKKIKFAGWTEIFMHPLPRGIPIHETAAEVTAEINRSRKYLSQCLAQV